MLLRGKEEAVEGRKETVTLTSNATTYLIKKKKGART